MQKWIKRSFAIQAAHGNSDESSVSDVKRNLEDYVANKPNGKTRNAKGVINGLYSRAAKGDLVLVTSPGQAWGKTSIGEFVDDPTKITYIKTSVYKGEEMPARRVRWLGEIENVLLPRSLIKQLSSQNAFTLVGKSDHAIIFDKVYGNYFRADQANSIFSIRGDDFTTVADFHLKLIANISAEIAKGYYEETLEDFLSKDLADWIFDMEEHEYSPTQKININSPGPNLLKSATISPILAMVIFAVCQLSPSDIKAGNFEFVNSANEQKKLDDCDIPVAESALIAFKLMSLDKLEKMCRAAQSAKVSGDIRTPVKAEALKNGK